MFIAKYRCPRCGFESSVDLNVRLDVVGEDDSCKITNCVSDADIKIDSINRIISKDTVPSNLKIAEIKSILEK